MAQVSISTIYERLGKGTPSAGDNLSLANTPIGAPPSVDPDNLSATYNVYGNAWANVPFGRNISMGNADSWYTAGDFKNDSSPKMTFKFSPPSDVAADLYGDESTYSATFPYNKGQLGIKMNNILVADGGIAGTYAYDVNSSTTWTSVAPGTSYKHPNTSNTSATICFWFKPITQATARNFFWSDVDAIGDINPYRGWWFQFNTTGTIGFNRGDGTGTAASDRYSFTSTAVFDGSGDFWQFAAVLISNNENTVTTGTNYFWGYRYDGRSSTWGWVNGASYTSGTGGAMAYSADSGTETTNCFAINPQGNTSNGLQFDIGHIYVFTGELSTAQVEYVREMTDGYTA